MKKLIYIIVVAVFLVNCNSDDDILNLEESNLESTLTTIPEDVTKLFSANGNENADTVLIYEQGGPDTELDDQYFEINGSFNSEYNDLFKEYYRVYIHQALTLNDGLCTNDTLSKEQANLENKVSLEILDKVIKYFKSQGKKVYVMGHSFGGFLVTKYIAEKGNNTADKFIIMAARIEMQSEVPNNFLQGRPYYFLNGTTPKEEDRSELLEEYNKIKQSCPSVFSFLGAIGSERFSSTIATRDLSNVIYVFAKDDLQTGGLLETEKIFLRDRKVKVIEIETGGHGAMFNSPYPKQVFELLK